MPDQFFKQPVLNSPYEYPGRHWELDEQGQPTQRIIERRRNDEADWQLRCALLPAGYAYRLAG